MLPDKILPPPYADPTILAFGIPSLDRLIGIGDSKGEGTDRDRAGYALETFETGNESATFCIVGPDGTGKSVLALHLASEYWRRTHTQETGPRIIYASTDLAYERATRIWRRFWLDRPQSRYRRLPFEERWIRSETPLTPWERLERKSGLVALTKYHPTETSVFRDKSVSFSDYLIGGSSGSGVAFLDLESDTSGDDWSFLHKLLAVVERPKSSDSRHLLVIDAVEGLETLVGDRDGFGQLQSRRSRIAQIVRAAASKCHVVFVVEEQKDQERLPEVFVADTVVRLRSNTDRDYARRTLEMEKVRAQKHVRGQHDFRIRQECSTTGSDPNTDDPRVGIRGDSMAYIQVFPSLHYLTRDVPTTQSPRSQNWSEYDWRFCEFGIAQLDSMLWRARTPQYLKEEEEDLAKGLQPRTRSVDLNAEDVRHRLCYQKSAWFKLTDQSFTALRRANVPEVVLTKLNPLKDKELSRESMVKEITKILNEKERKQFQDKILNNAQIPEGQWPTSLRLASTRRVSKRLVAALYDELTQIVESTLPGSIAGFDRLGLPAGSITTLIGNDSTYKSHLARAFLSQCFRKRRGFREPWFPIPFIASKLRVAVANDNDPLEGHGVAALLATYDTDRGRLAETLEQHLLPRLGKNDSGITSRLKGIQKGLLVRALKPHYLPSAALVHMIERLVEEAKERLYAPFLSTKTLPTDPDELRRLNGRIRLVIDDWSTILATYPEVQRDPLVLPFVMSYLRRQGVTVLIVATRSGNPEDRETGELEQDIRELRAAADHHLYTWHVSFFDERRVAISVLPNPVPGAGLQVRELRPARIDELMIIDKEDQTERAKDDAKEQLDTESVIVDPHFELYAGLPDGKPIQVPLEVRLFAERDDVPPIKEYLDELSYLFRHLFGPDHRQAVLSVESGVGYNRLREVSYLQSEAQLDRTLVVQVDEFWAESRSDLRRQERYLFARTVEPDGRPVKAEDPFGLFQLTDAIIDRKTDEAPGRQSIGPLRRIDFFDLIGHDCEATAKRFAIDKVPYAWDFGFLICDNVAWTRACRDEDEIERIVPDPSVAGGFTSKRERIREVWKRLWRISSESHGIQSILLEGLGPPEDRRPLAHWTSSSVDDLDDDFTEFYWQDEMAEPPDTDTRPQSSRGLPFENQIHPDPVSWRDFFQACRAVDRASPGEFVTFDIDLLATETLSCLMLEIWFSEVFQAKEFTEKLTETRPRDLTALIESRWWPRNCREAPHGAGLTELLGARIRTTTEQEEASNIARLIAPSIRRQTKGNLQINDPDPRAMLYRRALYRTMLMLSEMLDHGQLADRDLNLESRPARPTAIAARHWYSTATIAKNTETDRTGRILVGLPGHFAVRGDWFLAVAKGSRSPRLGERAIDVLCSRRANITRLQTGIGLPVRDMHGSESNPSDKERRTEYWTSIPFIGEDRVPQLIPYRELRKLGAWDARDRLGRAGNFGWLWRSSIDRYDLHLRIWQRWLVHMLRWWRTSQPPRPSGPHLNLLTPHLADKTWPDGFAEYDHYIRCELQSGILCYVDTENNPRWDEFSQFCDGLIEGLKRASRNES